MITNRGNGIVDSLLIFLLIFAPLTYGAVHTPSRMIFSLSAVILSTLYFLNSPSEPLRELLKLPLVKGGIFFVIVIFFQLLPLPGTLLNLISPSTFQLFNNYALTYDPLTTWRSISIYSWATIYQLIIVISYGLIFLVVFKRATSGPESTVSIPESLGKPRSTIHHSPFTIHHSRLTSYIQLGLLTSILSLLLHSLCDFNLQIPANAFYFTVLLALLTGIARGGDRTLNHHFIQKTVSSIILIGFFISLLAIIQSLSFNGRIYWLGKEAGSAFGPYVNRNHYAGFMQLCIPLTMASFMGSIVTSKFYPGAGLRRKILWFSSPRANKALLYLFFSVIMTASLFLSLSRGGIISFIISLSLLFLIMIIKTGGRRHHRAIFSFLLTVLLITLMIMWMGPEPLLERAQTLREIIHEPMMAQARVHIWKDTTGIIKDFPLLGTGLGTFSHIYPKYRTLKGTMKFVRYPENDYVQLVSEMGLFGLISIIAFLIFFIKRYIQAVRRIG